MSPSATNGTTSKLQVPRPALMRQKTRESFQAPDSLTKKLQAENGTPEKAMRGIFVGIAITPDPKQQEAILVGISAHDGTYSMDYGEHRYFPQGLRPEKQIGDTLEEFIYHSVIEYREAHSYKFVGGAMTEDVFKSCPELPQRLWMNLDMVMLILKPFEEDHKAAQVAFGKYVIDEESDDIVRKAVQYFGTNNQPRVTLRIPNEVEVDAGGRIQIASEKLYKSTVHENTWKATMHYANSLKARKMKIAFFNTTPQGGGVALMRHALVRFLRLIDVDCKWYVPRPNNTVFRTTKDNHNILQGVAEKGEVFGEEQIKLLDDWCRENAKRYWTDKGGPLAPRSEGGADVIIIDDPQMPSLVAIAKEKDPERPVIFRSHIQVRADLANDPTTYTAAIWKWVWNHVKKCDVFVSHPVRDFVPDNVTPEKVGYMPATTDFCDGLNKHMGTWETHYYLHEFWLECKKRGLPTLDIPKRKHIVQIARFDPAKGIPDVLSAYACLRREYMNDWEHEKTPQLVIAGHGAIDDPDASIIYDATTKLISDHYPEFAEDIIVQRVGPTDQILNALMHNAHVALQLSTREGFEVKVSEALKHGVPIIATRRGGIPLQVKHELSGFLVESGEHQKVAKYLYHLFTDEDAYAEMSAAAAANVSDEVSTVGNALSWLYLADTLSKGKKIEPDSRWINDMARETAGVPYEAEEVRLPRRRDLDLTHDRPELANGNGTPNGN